MNSEMDEFCCEKPKNLIRFGAFERAVKCAESFEAFYLSEASSDLCESILQQVDDRRIVSFDIFDTVLWRDDKSELARFADVARAFSSRMSGHTPEAWLMARILSASHAYQMSEMIEHTTEGRLRDIALNMMHSMRISCDRHQAAEFWSQIELEVEIAQLRISPFINRLIDLLVERQKTVIFLSDMYLQADQIRQILNSLEFDTNRVTHIISSADQRVNKRSGTIFSHVSRGMNAHDRDFLHLGDSLISDFVMPIRAGWAARHLPVPRAVQVRRRDCHFQTCSDLFGRRDYNLPMAVPTF